MKGRKTVFSLIILACGAAVVICIWRGLYMPGAWLVLLLCFAIFLSGFEKRRISAEEAVLIAVLSASAAAGRVFFAPIPSVQPLSFFVICTASVFGGRAAMAVGALSAFISNIYLGQGPWTPWQMLAWGLMGIFSGLFFYLLNIKNRYFKLGFGFAAGVLFGFVMNFWYLVSFVEKVTLAGFLVAYSQSAVMDIMHGAGNVFFIFLFADKLEKVLMRYKEKYGILNRSSI